jgi:anhydro-N-acetylmuramic acid kinase
MSTMTAIGLMSGTSMDGIDLALIETDGQAKVGMGPSWSLSYAAHHREVLRRALDDATAMTQRDQRPGVLAQAEALVTAAHALVVSEFMSEQMIPLSDIDVIGFHGQTVLHRPAQRLTVQIGDGFALARTLRIPVVHDMRAADVAAGGQGAPLVPVFHQALVRSAGLDGPVAVLNLGGVGNLTYIDGDAPPIAFDTGPANALIDDEMLDRFALAYDEDGAVAASGQVDQKALAQMMAHPFFTQAWPKSLDRNAFSREPVMFLESPEAIATLTAFTAESIRAAEALLPAAPKLWVICGGGAANGTLREMIAQRVRGEVVTSDELGWSSRLMEARAFAYLAVRSLKGLPLTFPTTTGCPAPMTGGVLAVP